VNTIPLWRKNYSGIENASPYGLMVKWIVLYGISVIIGDWIQTTDLWGLMLKSKYYYLYRGSCKLKHYLPIQETVKLYNSYLNNLGTK
jgi:hypothetical protein